MTIKWALRWPITIVLGLVGLVYAIDLPGLVLAALLYNWAHPINPYVFFSGSILEPGRATVWIPLIIKYMVVGVCWFGIVAVAKWRLKNATPAREPKLAPSAPLTRATRPREPITTPHERSETP